MSENKRVRVQPDRAAARAKRIRNLAEEFSPAPFKRYPPFNPPITDYKKVPGGWNGEDEDIDEKWGLPRSSHTILLMRYIEMLRESFSAVMTESMMASCHSGGKRN